MVEIPLLCADGLGVNTSVGRAARARGHTTGRALTLDAGWDFSRPEHRQRALRQLQRDKPYFLVLPVPLEPWMQASVLHVSRDRRRQQLQSILPSLRFALRLARLQLGGGRHFVFEHPPNSSIWRLPGVRALLADPRCRSLTVDLGKFGSTSQGGARKQCPPTRLLTSSQAVVSNLLGGVSKDRAEPNNLGYPKAFADKLVQAFEPEFDYDETARLFNKVRAHECHEIVGSHGGLDFVHEALAG